MKDGSAGAVRVTFDVGGTYTDVVIVDGTDVRTRKVLNGQVLGDVASAIAQEISGIAADRQVAVVHATTVASNAVVEGSYARTGMITTSGFRDELEVRRMARPGVYDFMWERPEAVVPRDLRLEVREAVRATGAVEKPLVEADVEEVLEALRAAGVEAVAVCLINSYMNPVHEQRVVEAARERGFFTSASSDISREVGEFERSSTTAVNAALLPVIDRYLDEVELPFRRLNVPFSLMQANGGITTPAIARRAPVRLIESGPAAGVLGAAALAISAGIEGAIAFDMGGTTVKACLIEYGHALERAEFEVGGAGNISARYSRGGGHLVRSPAFDLVELGAGGGSKVWLDGDGLLRVGPRSAGAVPGPAAYGRGGLDPTVTDANVILGHIAPGPFGDGSVSIDRELAEKAFASIAAEMGISVEDAAFGAIEVADATMIRALRAVSTERGRDPGELTLVAFGGGGPIHAARLADRVGIPSVVVPAFAGVFSAIGLQLAETRFDFAQSLPEPVALRAFADLRRHLLDLEDRARNELSDLLRQDGGDGPRFQHLVDLRYLEQAAPLTFAVERDADNASLVAVVEAFEAEHERLYGYRRAGVTIEAASVRLRVSIPRNGRDITVFRDGGHTPTDRVAEGRRSVYLGADLGRQDVWSTPRRSFFEGTGPLAGPGVVTEADTTTVVPPGWSVAGDRKTGSLVLTRDGRN